MASRSLDTEDLLRLIRIENTEIVQIEKEIIARRADNIVTVRELENELEQLTLIIRLRQTKISVLENLIQDINNITKTLSVKLKKKPNITKEQVKTKLEEIFQLSPQIMVDIQNLKSETERDQTLYDETQPLVEQQLITRDELRMIMNKIGKNKTRIKLIKEIIDLNEESIRIKNQDLIMLEELERITSRAQKTSSARSRIEIEEQEDIDRPKQKEQIDFQRVERIRELGKIKMSEILEQAIIQKDREDLNKKLLDFRAQTEQRIRDAEALRDVERADGIVLDRHISQIQRRLRELRERNQVPVPVPVLAMAQMPLVLSKKPDESIDVIPDEKLHEYVECKICYTNTTDIILSCGHLICTLCYKSIKNTGKCPHCRKNLAISGYLAVAPTSTDVGVAATGTAATGTVATGTSAEFNQIIRSALRCQACSKNKKQFILSCGHIVCNECYNTSINTNKICPICQQSITAKNDIFYKKYLKYKNKYLQLKKSKKI